MWPCVAVGVVGVLAMLAAPTLRSGARPPSGPPEVRERAAPLQAPSHSAVRPEVSEAGNDDGPEEEGLRNPPIPLTERWYLEKYRRLARRDPEAFDRTVDWIVRAPGPLQEKVAVLRAAYEQDNIGALERFAAVLSGDSRPSGEPTDVLQRFAVNYLSPRARTSPEVRVFLRDRVFFQESLDPRLRRIAGRAVLQSTDPQEIPALLPALTRISDPTVMEGAARGLSMCDHEEGRSALSWLSEHHPEPEARRVCLECLTADGEDESEE